MNERNLNEGQWEDRQQWSLGAGQRRKTFLNRYIYIYIYIYICVCLYICTYIYAYVLSYKCYHKNTQIITICLR